MIDNSFKLDMLLGTGGSSRVYSCYDPSGELHAVKIIRKDKNFSQKLSESLLQTEYQIMQEMAAHPNILNSLYANLEGKFEVDGKQEQIMYCLIELASKGTIKTFIKKSGCLEEGICKFYFLQLANALSFMHDHNYAHMDVKLDNILLDQNFNIKLADLGTCVRTQEGYTNKRCGTKQYIAPEVSEGLSGEIFNAFKADAYSLGVTLFAMLTGTFPNSTEHTSLTNDSSDNDQEIDTSKGSNLLLSHVSEECRDLLFCLLSEDPHKRFSVIEALAHPWVVNQENSASSSNVYLEMSAREDYIVDNFATKSSD